MIAANHENGGGNRTRTLFRRAAWEPQFQSYLHFPTLQGESVSASVPSDMLAASERIGTISSLVSTAQPLIRLQLPAQYAVLRLRCFRADVFD